MVSLWERGNSVKGHSHFWCKRNYILLLPSSVDKKIRFVQLPIRTATGLCRKVWCEKLYRGWRWQDDVSNGGFQLIDGGSALMSAIVWLNGLDFYMELPGFVFVLWVAGWIEGIIFGMWKKRVKETKTTNQCETKDQRISTLAFKFRPWPKNCEQQWTKKATNRNESTNALKAGAPEYKQDHGK